MERKNNNENNIEYRKIDKYDDRDIMRSIIYGDGFSHNGVSISLDDYIHDGVLNPDWIYSVARKIANNHEQFGRTLLHELSDRASKVRRLYRDLPVESRLRRATNRPVLPYREYFQLVELLERNPERYQGPDGYIQVARDMHNIVPAQDLVTAIWPAYEDRNEEHEVFHSSKYLFRHRHNRKENQGVIINNDADVKKYFKPFDNIDDIDNVVEAHLGGIWYATNEQLRTELNWTPNKIDLPLAAFDLIQQMTEYSRNHGLGEIYEGFEGIAALTVYIDHQGFRSIKPEKTQNLFNMVDNDGMSLKRPLLVDHTSVWRAADEQLRQELDWPSTYLEFQAMETMFRASLAAAYLEI